MGRKGLESGQETAYLDSIQAQISQFCSRTKAAYLKPHGGFYNDLAVPLTIGWDSMLKHPGSKSPYEAGGQEISKAAGAGLLVILLRVHKLMLMGLPSTYLEEIGRRSGFGFIKEGFADRRYTAQGLLAPRSESGSVLKSSVDIKEQVLKLSETCDSLCVHGDTENAVAIAALVRQTVEQAGFEVKA